MNNSFKNRRSRWSKSLISCTGGLLLFAGCQSPAGFRTTAHPSPTPPSRVSLAKLLSKKTSRGESIIAEMKPVHTNAPEEQIETLSDVAEKTAVESAPSEIVQTVTFEEDTIAENAPETSSIPSVEQLGTIEPSSILGEGQPLSSIEQPTITLAQLEELALCLNPAVAAAQARVEAMKGKWQQVGLAPNPTVGYMADEVGGDGSGGFQGVYASQQFITGGKLDLNRAAAYQELTKAEQRWVAARQRVLTDVRTNYYNMLIAQRKLELAEKLATVSEKAVATSEALVAAKETSVVALLQTEIQAKTAVVVAQQAHNEIEAAWRRLAVVTGQPEMAPHRVEGEFDIESALLDWDQELDNLLSNSPELSEAFAEIERARWSMDRAVAQNHTNVQLQLSLQQDTVSDDIVTGIQLGMPIPLWNRNQGGIYQAQSDIAAAHKEQERIELNLRQRLTATYQNYLNASVQVEMYRDEILPRAERSFALVSRGYEAGEVGYLNMSTAQTTFFQTELDYIASQQQLWQHRLLIEGLLLNNSLSTAQN